ncbi:Photosystem II reaction center protein K [Capsicum annuum]|uniref:Photosystem II reaction center protein K n=1 Tax=Capsicum annuum TaxID=4072 RepID=A0A2G2XV21_CAPAN|nr:Photosystem II reaction center protein K [Capsicum annuum]
MRGILVNLSIPPNRRSKILETIPIPNSQWYSTIKTIGDPLFEYFFLRLIAEAYAFLNPIVYIMPVMPLFYFLLPFVWQAVVRFR